MKIKIRESSEKISYFDSIDQEFNHLKIKIIQVIKYIICTKFLTIFSKEFFFLMDFN